MDTMLIADGKENLYQQHPLKADCKFFLLTQRKLTNLFDVIVIWSVIENLRVQKLCM